MSSARPSSHVPMALGYALMVLSIGLIPTWPDLMGHAAALSAQADAAGSLLGNAHLSLLVGMIVGGLVLASAPRLVIRHLEATALAAGVVGVASTFTFATGTQPLGSLAVSACGVCLILLYGVTFYPLSAVAGMPAIGWVCTAALVLKELSLHLVDLLPPGLAVPLVACAPLASGLGACACGRVMQVARREPAGTGGIAAPTLTSGRATHASVTILVVVSCVAYALMRCGSNMVLWGPDNQMAALGPAALGYVVMAFAIACYATFVKAPGDLMLKFVPSVLVQLALFGAIWCGLTPTLGLTDDLGVPILSELAELYGHMYMFMVMFLALSVLGEAGVRVHGVQWALSAGCVALALAIGLDRADAAQFACLVCTNAAMVVAFAATHVAFGRDQLAAVAKAARMGRTVPVEEGEGADGHGDRGIIGEMATALDALSSRFLLSEREREVLALIVQGRTRDSIGDQMCLAPGTVSTYIARIYRKLRVHSRQELIGLVYQEFASPGRTPDDADAQ